MVHFIFGLFDELIVQYLFEIKVFYNIDVLLLILIHLIHPYWMKVLPKEEKKSLYILNKLYITIDIDLHWFVYFVGNFFYVVHLQAWLHRRPSTTSGATHAYGAPRHAWPSWHERRTHDGEPRGPMMEQRGPPMEARGTWMWFPFICWLCLVIFMDPFHRLMVRFSVNWKVKSCKCFCFCFFK